MISLTTSYSLRNASAIQDTVYVLRLAAPVSIDYSTEQVSGLTTSSFIDDRPAFSSASLNVLSGSSSIGSISLVLVDVGKAVTETRRGAQFIGCQADLYEGYRGMAWNGGTDWLRTMSGKISRFERTSDGIGYKLEIADKLDPLDVDIFQASDIGAEYVTGVTKSFDSGSLVLSDADDDGIYDTATVTGNPVDIALKIMLSGGDAVSADYNVWPVWAGCGLTEDDVDIDWCEAERDKISVVSMRLTLSDGENAKSFLETEICKALGGYLLTSGTSKIRIRYPSAPAASASLQTLDDSVILQKPIWSDSRDLLITHVDFELDHDGDGFQLKLPRRASPQWLAGDYLEERVHKVSSRGLQSDLGGVSVADSIIDTLFERYGDPPPKIKIKNFYRMRSVEPGDVVKMESDYYPDVDGLGTGGTRLLEVLSVRAQNMSVDIDAIDLTSPLTEGRHAVIAPDSIADYTSATTAQQDAYAFIADAGTGQLSNGDTAYIWS